MSAPAPPITHRPLALVTGGMRRLGAVIADRLAGAGYDLALSTHDSGHDSGHNTGHQDGNAEGERRCFVADLSNPDNASDLLDRVSRHFGRVPDLLVNNAAMFGQDRWPEMTAETLEAHFRLNVFAPVLLARALVDAAGPERQPCIIHILDQRIVNPHGDQLSYTLSKQALAASVRSMAASFGARARVNGVAPGLVISTEDYDSALENRLAGMMPLGALPSPDGVAEAVLYLAGASHVTGQIIFADGGANLKSFERDFMHL